MARANYSTVRANFRSIGRVNIENIYTRCLGLVFNKLLEFTPSPAVQPRAYTLSGFNSLTNIGQIFHDNYASIRGYSFINNRLADNMVSFFDVQSFFAGDSYKAAFSRLRTVGLKFASSCKKLVSLMPQLASSVDSSIRGGGQIIFTYINTKNIAIDFKRCLWNFDAYIKKPVIAFFNKFSFFGVARIKNKFLMFSKRELAFDSSAYTKQRQSIIFYRICSLVIMHATTLLKINSWYWLRFFNLQDLVSRANFLNSIASHLRSERPNVFTNYIITQVVKGYSIPASIFNNNWHKRIACKIKLLLGFKQTNRLFLACRKLKAYSFYHIGKYNKKQNFKQYKIGAVFPPTTQSYGFPHRIFS